MTSTPRRRHHADVDSKTHSDLVSIANIAVFFYLKIGNICTLNLSLVVLLNYAIFK